MTLQEQADKLIFDAVKRSVYHQASVRGLPRVVCAWCGIVMRGGPPQPISHSICETCFEEEMKK